MSLLRDIDATELKILFAYAEPPVVAPELGRLYMELVGERFANDAMIWASTHDTKRESIAGYVVAGAVPLTLDGIQSAASLDESGFILAAVIDRALRKAPQQWLRSATMEPDFWECLLNGVEQWFCGGGVGAYVGKLDRSAIGRARNAHITVERAPRTVQVGTDREVLLDHLLGAVTSEDL